MCHEIDSRPPYPPIAGGSAHGEDAILTADDGSRFLAYLAHAESSTGAKLVIFPDAGGMRPYYKDLAQRFAEQGTDTVVMDFYGRAAGIDERGADFNPFPHMEQVLADGFVADVRASLAALREHTGHGRAAFTLGFCKGGALSLQAGAEDLGLAGVIGFYGVVTALLPGRGTPLEQATRIQVPVLAFFGGADQYIKNEDVQKFVDLLDEASVEHEVVVYPNIPHSFFDRTSEQYADESTDAWQRSLAFIAAHTPA